MFYYYLKRWFSTKETNRRGNNYEHKGNETMDADTKKAMGTNASKALNTPEALFVEVGPSGSPIAVKLKHFGDKY